MGLIRWLARALSPETQRDAAVQSDAEWLGDFLAQSPGSEHFYFCLFGAVFSEEGDQFRVHRAARHLMRAGYVRLHIGRGAFGGMHITMSAEQAGAWRQMRVAAGVPMFRQEASL